MHEILEAEFNALHGNLPEDYPSSTEPTIRLKAISDAIHSLKEKRAALCISGGGIRSATFGLGILQGLARCGLLNKFHYLSTVSGGGYIGSWLSAWIKNHPQGVEGVVTELKRRPDSILEPEPQPIQHLREFSNYLAPRPGLTFMDSWTLLTTFIRNMFLNWLVLISWLAAFLMIPRLCLASISLHPELRTWTDNVTHEWDMGLKILLAVGFALITVAMAYAIIDVPTTGNARLPQRRFLIYRQLPLFLAALILAAWWALYWNIHFGDPFPAHEWLWRVGLFVVLAYLCGGVCGTVVVFYIKKRRGRFTASLSRLGTILLISAFAGISLWAMATRIFLSPSKIEFRLKRDCSAVIQIPIQQEVVIPARTERILMEGGAPVTGSDFRIKLVDACNAIQSTTQNEIKIPAGTQAEIAGKDFDALERLPVPSPVNDAVNYVCFSPALILAVFLLVNFLFTGLTSRVSEDEDREWWARSAAWIIVTIVTWTVVNVVVLWGAQTISASENQFDIFLGKGDMQASTTAKALLSSFGGVTGIAGALLVLRSKLSSKLGRRVVFNWSLVIGAVMFLILLSIVISWALLLVGSEPWAIRATKLLLGGYTSSGWWVQLFVVFFLTGLMLILGIVMGLFIDANKFSLHATYRNRLIRAYLAASRAAETRKPSLFTGFDPSDNFALCELPSERPFHVINAALNLVRGQQLAWQERKAESFTMSRLHCGSWPLGYRPSAEYGNGISLGTAMAISGAAANPEMGYHSSTAVCFLMTLFNVRLGWWLGNPGPRGATTWRRSGPWYSVGPVFAEAFGNTTDRYKYVNLSDGGHFENLGLYEMVLRRCHFIVVSDASQDAECSFADLGEAVRKIRIDFEFRSSSAR